MDNVTTKKVIEDWDNAFPQLSIYAQDKLYKVVGPLIFGLEIIKLPRTEEYRPHFTVYALWENTVKDCLAYPIYLSEFKDNRGFQYSIPYEQHKLKFNEVAENVKKQLPLPLEGSITIHKMTTVFQDYAKRPPLSAAPNSYFQANSMEARFKSEIYVGSNMAVSTLNEIRRKEWDVAHFKACNVDYKQWVEELDVLIKDPSVFLKKVKVNKLDKKIVQLPEVELLS
jgi:hypothetical protein